MSTSVLLLCSKLHLETELDKTNRHLVYWSTRALNAEKKLKMIGSLIEANDKDVKKFLLFENNS